MNRQQILDTVVAHLLKQGRKAIEYSKLAGGRVCQYRTKDGKKCAIGCLIPDEYYHEAMEGVGVQCLITGVMMGNGIAPKGLPEFFCLENAHLLDLLQDLHDGAKVNDDDMFDMPALFSKIGQVAKAFHLTVPTEAAP